VTKVIKQVIIIKNRTYSLLHPEVIN